MRLISRSKEAEAEAKIEQYAREKEERQTLLKAKAAEREKARTERRQRMIEQQRRYMEEQLQNVEERLQVAQKQQNEKIEREANMKAEKQRQLLQDIQDAIDQQVGDLVPSNQYASNNLLYYVAAREETHSQAARSRTGATRPCICQSRSNRIWGKREDEEASYEREGKRAG